MLLQKETRVRRTNMTTAAQAREKTMEKINQIAKEFIINCAESAIDEATKLGNFSTSVNFKDVINPAQTGEEVVNASTSTLSLGRDNVTSSIIMSCFKLIVSLICLIVEETIASSTSSFPQ